MILLESVSKTYEMGEGVVRALDHVDLQVDQGDFLAIVGPSGSGKSTLMNILGLLDVPDEGRYLLDGMDVGALSDNRLASIRNEKIGFVFQSFNLLGKLTALENVKLPLSYAGVRLKEADARARKQLSLVGLEGREHHLPNQLSGGQQQRVAIARALAMKPEIMLFDEPTSALDPELVGEVLNVMLNNFDTKYDEQIEEGAKELGLTTHEVVVIASLIEREAKEADEFSKISGVIHNRLNNSEEYPYLQIDASLQYAVGHNNPLTEEDLKLDSPYNLYTNKGLPPGPICNPGYNALYAATHPDDHGYYYYVAMPDGTHLFAETNSEHNRNRERAKEAWAEANNE